MRTKAAGAAAILANPSHGGVVFVQVYDASGVTPYRLDLQTFPGDPLLAVSVQEDVDGPRTASITLLRQQGARSLAPLVTAGNPLAGLVDVGRRVQVLAAVVPPDSEAWAEAPTIFDGYIDQVEWPDDSLVLTCTDKSAKLRDTWIEVERAYGFATGASATKGTLVWAPNATVAINDLVVPSQANGNGHFYKVTAGAGSVGSTEPTWPTGSGATVALAGITYTEVGTVSETGTPLETIIQQVLNDNGLGSLVTLQTPASPSWLVRPFIQQRQSVAEAIRAMVDQLGWSCRFEWSSGLGRYELTLRQPNRSATTPDKALLATEELKTSALAVDVFSIRNVVRVVYSETASRTPTGVVPRKVVEVSDASSIAKYGRRFMEISESDTSQIDSLTEAQRMAQAAVDDLKEPGLPMTVAFPVDPYLELGDLVQLPADGLRFSAAQVLAVDRLTHRFGPDGASTEVSLRGKPASQRLGWLELDARLAPEDVHQVSPLETVGATVQTVSNVVGGVSIILTYSLMKGGAPPGVEVHVSASSGFIPDASTLKAYGQASSFTVAQLVPGKTYYGRLVPYTLDAGGAMVRGQPGAEFSFVAGQAQAGHYSSTSTQSHLPLNGNFEHATDDLASAPPDHWKVVALGGESESWGAAGSMYYGTDSTRGRFITFRAHASQRGRILSDPFEVQRGQLVSFAMSIRRNGASGATLGLILRVRGYADAALSTLVSDSTDQIIPGTATPYALGTWYEWGSQFEMGAANFLQVELRRQSIDATHSWDVGDVYAREVRFPAVSLATLDVTGNAAFAGNITVFPGSISAPIVTEAWNAPSFLNSWANLGGTLNAGYCKDAAGFVHLRGTVAGPAASRFLPIFNLPTGYRPSAQARAWVAGNGRGALLAVASSGDVYLVIADSATPEASVSLDGITFDTR